MNENLRLITQIAQTRGVTCRITSRELSCHFEQMLLASLFPQIGTAHPSTFNLALLSTASDHKNQRPTSPAKQKTSTKKIGFTQFFRNKNRALRQTKKRNQSKKTTNHPEFLAWSGGEGTSSPGGKERVRTPRLRGSPSVRARQSLPATLHISGSRASIAKNITHRRAPESRAVSCSKTERKGMNKIKIIQ